MKRKENSTPDELSQFPSNDEEWVQEGPEGTLHSKGILKPKTGEVLVGSSPPPAVAGIVGRALAKDNCVAGWMVLAGWDLDATTAEEVEEAKDLELETVMTCQESLCTMGSGAEEYRGEAMSIQAKSVT